MLIPLAIRSDPVNAFHDGSVVSAKHRIDSVENSCVNLTNLFRYVGNLAVSY
jgi:hypothetical protein